jgi:hypothetical protein
MVRSPRWWCGLVLGMCGVCCAQTQSSSVAFTLEDNLVRVPIVLNGQPVEAVLDSGTGSLGLDHAYAVSLRLKLGDSIGMVPGGGAPEPMFPLTVKHLSFGPVELSDVPGIALDLGHISSSSGFAVPVLMGQPVIKDRAMRVDYLHRRVIFLRPGEEAACADPLPVTFYGGTPVVTVVLQATAESEARTLHLILDLGTRHYAALLGGSFLATPEAQAMEGRSKEQELGSGTGGVFSGYVGRVATLTVGKRSFTDLTVALSSHVGAFQAGVVDGSMGVPLWVGGAVTLDYAHGHVCIDVASGEGK